MICLIPIRKTSFWNIPGSNPGWLVKFYTDCYYAVMLAGCWVVEVLTVIAEIHTVMLWKEY